MRQARLHANLTQQAVAERAGLLRNNYGLIERGQASPRLHTLLNIADAIGVPLAHLVRE